MFPAIATEPRSGICLLPLSRATGSAGFATGPGFFAQGQSLFLRLVDGLHQLPSGISEPPAMGPACTIELPACSEALAVRHILAPGIDEVHEHRNDRTSVVA